MTTKRKRTDLCFGDKQKICQYKSDNPKATYKDIQVWTESTLGVTIGRSTIGDILKQSEKWFDNEIVHHHVRRRHPKFEHLENALYVWYCDVRSRGCMVSDEMMIENAKTLGAMLHIPSEDFAYSRGWLARFKARKNIFTSALNRNKENDVLELTIDSAQQSLKEVIADYKLIKKDNKLEINGECIKLEPSEKLSNTVCDTVKEECKETNDIASSTIEIKPLNVVDTLSCVSDEPGASSGDIKMETNNVEFREALTGIETVVQFLEQQTKDEKIVAYIKSAMTIKHYIENINDLQ